MVPSVRSPVGVEKLVRYVIEKTQLHAQSHPGFRIKPGITKDHPLVKPDEVDSMFFMLSIQTQCVNYPDVAWSCEAVYDSKLVTHF